MAETSKTVGSTTFTKETKDVQQTPEAKDAPKVSMTALQSFAHPGGEFEAEVESQKDEKPATGMIMANKTVAKGDKFKVPESLAAELEKAGLAERDSGSASAAKPETGADLSTKEPASAAKTTGVKK